MPYYAVYSPNITSGIVLVARANDVEDAIMRFAGEFFSKYGNESIIESGLEASKIELDELPISLSDIQTLALSGGPLTIHKSWFTKRQREKLFT